VGQRHGANHELIVGVAGAKAPPGAGGHHHSGVVVVLSLHHDLVQIAGQPRLMALSRSGWLKVMTATPAVVSISKPR
jgi:hypothetical protein